DSSRVEPTQRPAPRRNAAARLCRGVGRAACLQRTQNVSDEIQPQLGRLIALPMATIGVLAAILVWELEHVGSIALALLVIAGAVFAALVIARRVRMRIGALASHYEALLRTADAESRRAEAANRVKGDFRAKPAH